MTNNKTTENSKPETEASTSDEIYNNSSVTKTPPANTQETSLESNKVSSPQDEGGKKSEEANATPALQTPELETVPEATKSDSTPETEEIHAIKTDEEDKDVEIVNTPPSPDSTKSQGSIFDKDEIKEPASDNEESKETVEVMEKKPVGKIPESPQDTDAPPAPTEEKPTPAESEPKEPIIITPTADPEPTAAIVKPVLNFLGRLKELRTQANQKRTEQKQINLDKILAYAREHNRIDNKDVRELTGVSSERARQYLDLLEKQGLLTQFSQNGPQVFYMPIQKK